MATKCITLLAIAVCASAEKSKSTDDFATFNAALGGMDYFWIFYCIGAVIFSFLCIIPGCVCNSWCKSDKYDALSEKCYTDIINTRGYNASSKALGDNRPLALLVLRQDLKEKLIWHHDWKKDFGVFIRNEHALFSMCFSHADHPFSRRDRRIILLSVILLDFGIAMSITYAMTFYSFSETTSFILDFLISYIFGAIMSTLESFLVSFAVCAGSEKCPTCVRLFCKCCSSLIIGTVLIWALIGFIVSVIVMANLAKEPDTATFWEVFGLNFVLGMFQAWFLIDLIKMALQFRSGWKDAHPPTEPDEIEEDKKKKSSVGYKMLKYGFCCICFPVWLLIQCCCRQKEKEDPYDDGQDDFGVNYKEYLRWKSGEDIGDRKFPQSYAAFSAAGLAKSVNAQVDSAKQKVDEAKQAYEDTKKKGNKFAMGLQMKLGKKQKVKSTEYDEEEEVNNEEVELVVDQ